MSHLRARTNGVLFAITVILALIVFAIRFFSENSHTPGQMKPVLAIMDEKQLPDWSDANAGPALGARVPVMSGVAIDGQTGDIDFGSGGRRKVLFLMPDPDICADCHAAARELAEYWSRRHGDRLAFYLLYKGLPPVSAVLPSEDRSDSPLIVVGGVEPYLDALRTLTSRVFFVSETGRIEYFMDMPAQWRWLACDEAIRYFATKGGLPKSLPAPEWVYVGKPLPRMELRMLDGSPFRLAEEAKGAVAVLYSTSLGCKPCDTLYPVVRSLHESFGDLVKQYLIYGDPVNNEIAEKEVRRFKELVDHSPMIDNAKTNREQSLRQIQYFAERCHAEALISSRNDIINSWSSPIIESGALNLDFLGGEPFMRADLTDLIERCIERGIHVNVTTNGTKLSSAWLEKFDKKLGLLRIALDSADPEKHDSFRGIQGAWAETIKGIRSAVERGINVTVVTTFHRRNVHELDQLVDLMLELGVHAYANTILLPSGRGTQLNEDVLSPSELRAFCLAWGRKRSKLQEKKVPLTLIDEHPLTTLLSNEKGYKGQHCQVDGGLSKGRACTAGFIQAHMTPSGHLIPCGGMEGIPELHTDDNDVRKRSVHDIWMNSWIFCAMRDRMYTDRPFSIIDKCKDCKYLSFCGGGCRAASYLKFGDFYHTDPQCWYEPEANGDIHD